MRNGHIILCALLALTACGRAKQPDECSKPLH